MPSLLMRRVANPYDHYSRGNAKVEPIFFRCSSPVALIEILCAKAGKKGLTSIRISGSKFQS
jgi:hypothetical protein